MTAPTTTRSAYPAAVDALIPQARELAERLGGLPSRNRLMKEFRVGSPKATAIRDALTGPIIEPTRNTTERPRPHDDTPEAAPVFGPHTDTDTAETSALPSPVGHPDTTSQPADNAPAARQVRRPVVWPVFLLALPAFVAIWAGWVELGRLTGFGEVSLLPGIADTAVIDTAITLPIGVETYAAFALYVWLSGRASEQARKFAKRSAIASLGIGALGQIAYHLMSAAGWTSAPWLITAAVACLPVAVLGMGAALAHLLHTDH